MKPSFINCCINFTWWVNRKDSGGNNIFEGGFLGLDNIGVFDRNMSFPDGSRLEQSDGTSWMGMFCLTMMQTALELALENPVYENIATKFFEHFLGIAARDEQRRRPGNRALERGGRILSTMSSTRRKIVIFRSRSVR